MTGNGHINDWFQSEFHFLPSNYQFVTHVTSFSEIFATIAQLVSHIHNYSSRVKSRIYSSLKYPAIALLEPFKEGA
jgi:hypothetical protein